MPNESKKGSEKDQEKRPSFKSRNKGFKKTDANRITDKYRNDAAWYKKYPLMEQTANFPFAFVKGVPIEEEGFTPNASEAMPIAFATGVRITYVKSIGVSEQANDAFNFQMRALWLDLHRKYRGLGAYEWADLGISIWCVVSFFSEIARAARIYGALNYFNIRNRSVPKQLLTALGVSDPSGDDIANYRVLLNRIILKAKSLCLPKDLSIIDLFSHLDGAIFADSDSVRATWYLYDTEEYIKYDAASIDTGGCALYHKRSMTDGLQTLSDVIADLEDASDALVNDTDIARICSDMLAAYGDGQLLTVAEVNEDYTIIPKRDDSRLLQLQNTSICGHWVFGSDISKDIFSQMPNTGYDDGATELATRSRAVYQENGCIKQHLHSVCASASPLFIIDEIIDSANKVHLGVGDYRDDFTECTSLYAGNPLLNIWKDDPTTDDKIEMTRQIVGKTLVTHTGTDIEDPESTFANSSFSLSYGVVVVSDISIFGVSNVEFMMSLDRDIVTDADAAPTMEMAFLALMSHCDWHPCFFISVGDYDWTPTCDIDNYAFISKTSLRLMHDAATLSLFKCAIGVSTK